VNISEDSSGSWREKRSEQTLDELDRLLEQEDGLLPVSRDTFRLFEENPKKFESDQRPRFPRKEIENKTYASSERDGVLLSRPALNLEALVKLLERDGNVIGDGRSVGSEEGVEVTEEGVHGGGLGAGGGDGKGGGEVEGADGGGLGVNVLSKSIRKVLVQEPMRSEDKEGEGRMRTLMVA
jgi:hypothetical protein